MEIIDFATYRKLEEFYISSFQRHWEEEKYKWVALKCFQDNWDIDALDFWDMFDKATKKHLNLLASAHHYPKDAIRKFCKVAGDEAVRQMFRNLYDENITLKERIANFKSEADRIQKQYLPNEANDHDQDENSISTYLWFRFPDKYYIYKHSEISPLEKLLFGNNNIEKGNGVHNLIRAYDILDFVSKNLKDNDSINKLLDDNLTEDCYGDPNLKTLAVDFEFHISRYYPKVEGLIVRDTTGWINNFANDIQSSNYGVIWKHQLSDVKEVSKELRKRLEFSGYFWFYNIAHNKTNCRFRVIDFADNENYNTLKTKWKTNYNPCWFADDFSDYNDGNNKTAVIVFLVDKFEWIKNEDSLEADEFKTFNKKQAGRQNVVAYEYIKTNQINNMAYKNLHEIIKTLLEHAHNLILTGAPGTGKTYLAKQIAKEMRAEVGFVQFHPSYDYADFVEGLRPIQDDNGSVGFERKDGVFKAFCEKAIEKYENNNFEEAWTAFLNEVRETGNLMELKTPAGAIFYVSVNQRKNLTFYTGTDKKVGGSLTRKGVKTEFEGNPYYKYWLGYYNGVIDYMKSRHNLHSVEYTNKNFVFIIDEINRGDYSKIFGELFYSIDPGYRVNVSNISADKPIAIRTQYANMETEPNGFDSALGITDSNDFGHFFVPENVYIIGTMNDIDRSVESMDFAMRRRFAWKEVTAEDSMQMLDGLDNADEMKARMVKINDEILRTPGLGKAYQIGAAYFKKYELYNDFDLLWEYHLEGLLLEYLRGTTDIDKTMKKLADAYGYTKSNKYEPTSNN